VPKIIWTPQPSARSGLRSVPRGVTPREESFFDSLLRVFDIKLTLCACVAVPQPTPRVGGSDPGSPQMSERSQSPEQADEESVSTATSGPPARSGSQCESASPSTWKSRDAEEIEDDDTDAEHRQNAMTPPAAAVSTLQAFVQGRSPFTPHQKVLTWSFEEADDTASTKFRATVSFEMQERNHTLKGGWQSSKKKAQRDCAEKVLWFFQSALPMTEQHRVVDKEVDQEKTEAEESMDDLTRCIRTISHASAVVPALKWSFETSTKEHHIKHRATVAFGLNGQAHHYCGGWQCSKAKAQKDTADRVAVHLRRSAAQPAWQPVESSQAFSPASAEFHDPRIWGSQWMSSAGTWQQNPQQNLQQHAQQVFAAKPWIPVAEMATPAQVVVTQDNRQAAMGCHQPRSY